MHKNSYVFVKKLYLSYAFGLRNFGAKINKKETESLVAMAQICAHHLPWR